MECNIAYLDLLGFGSLSIKDVSSAAVLLEDYNYVLSNKINDANMHPELLKIANNICADSFLYFFLLVILSS